MQKLKASTASKVFSGHGRQSGVAVADSTVFEDLMAAVPGDRI